MIKLILPIFIAFAGFQIFAQDEIANSQKKNVLLAYENTSFKKNLIEAMDAMLKIDSISTTIVEHSKGALDKEDPATYQAIFISNSGVNSKVRPWITEWLKKNEKFSKSVILHVTQTGDWKVDAGVDAVTSASKKKEIKVLAAQYVELIKKRLASAQ